MAKLRSKKESEITRFVDQAKSAKASVLIRYHKLSVKDERELRKQLRAASCDIQIIKKTLLRRALKSMNLDLDSLKDTVGSFGIVYGLVDEVGPAKAVVQFAKKVPAITVVGGLYANEIIEKSQVMSLANLPTREQLLAQIANLLQSPMSRLVRSLAGPAQNMVNVLKARLDKISI